MLDRTQTNPDAGLQQVEATFTGKHVHMIGVGGSGMRALAEVLLRRGAIVCGSDIAFSASVEQLRQAGVTVHIGQQPENISAECDIVVYSAAVHDQNPELLAGRARGLEVLKYSQMLGRLMAGHWGIAVAGTHGKSTTSAMVAYVLHSAGLNPNYIVGATVEQLGGPCGVGGGKHFVAEACEFDRSFLNLCPSCSTILNLEEDHLDCYKDLDAIVEAFRQFVAKVPAEGVIIANGEDRNALKAVRDASAEVQTFGLTDKCTWQGTKLSNDRGRVVMDVLLGGEMYCRLTSPLPGLHNAYNSLAAIAMLHHCGLEANEIAHWLEQFSGTRRRMTLKGQGRGVTVVDDYAHHPTEIQATLKALRGYYQPRRLVCVFQPHQHSRTRFLLKDFARSFGEADEVIVPDIFFVRDSDREKDFISSQDLVSQIRLHGGSSIYLKEFEDISEYLRRNLTAGDLVVTMGAGNIWKVADEIVCWLGTDR